MESSSKHSVGAKPTLQPSSAKRFLQPLIGGFLVIAITFFSSSTSASESTIDICPKDRKEITSIVTYLRDPSRKTTIEDVAVGASAFTPYKEQNTSPGFDSAAYWLRLKLRNPASIKKMCWLALDWHRIQEATLYQFDPQHGWKAMKSGTSVPRNERPLPYAVPIFPIALDAGEQHIYYIRITSETAIDLRTSVGTEIAFLQWIEKRQLFVIMGIGASLATMLSVFIAWWILREIQYVYFGAVHLCAAIMDLSREGLLAYLFWPENLGFIPHLTLIFGSLGLYILFLLQQQITDMPEKAPLWNRIFNGLAITFILVIPLSYLSYSIAARFAAWITIVFFLLSFLFACVLWHQKQLSSRFLGLGYGLLWAAETVHQLAALGLIPWGISKSISISWLLVAASPLIIIALIYQTRMLTYQLDTAHNVRQAMAGFLARVGHELKAPLNVIIGYARLLGRRSERLQPEVVANDIVSNGIHLMEMIDELLDQSRIELGQFKIVVQPVHVKNWLNDIERDMGQLTSSYGNTFSFAQGSDIPACAIYDQRRLRQVISNLIGNANQHTQKGSVNLNVSARLLNDDKLHLAFAVVDNGTGIPSDDLARIFEPFVQGKRAVAGIGLGLSISREIITLMGGEISIKSSLGVGSEFSFWIECGICHESCEFDVTEEPIAENQYSFSGMQALALVDPEQHYNQLFSQLGALAVSTLSSHDCDEVASKLSTRSRYWDILLIGQNLSLPRLSALIATARANHPTILIYNVGDCNRVATQALRSGMPRVDGIIPLLNTMGNLASIIAPVTIAEKRLGWKPESSTHDHGSAPCINQLRHLVKMGEISEIDKWCERLIRHNCEAIDVATAIRQAAYAIDMQSLEALAASSITVDACRKLH